MEGKIIPGVILILTAIILTLGFMGLLNLTGNVVEEKQIVKIGAILPLTGANAIIGNDMKEGIDFAVEEYNFKNQNMQLIVLYEDSGGDQKNAISAYRKLRDIEKINLFISAQSHVSLALAPLVEKEKTILFVNAIAPSILDAGERTFVNNFNGEQELGYFVDYMLKDHNYKRLAILAQNIDYGVQYKDVLERKWIENGGKVVRSELFESAVIDYKTPILKIKESNPDFIYIVGYPNHLGKILVQMKELDIKQPKFSYFSAKDETVLDIAKDASNGLIFTGSPFSNDTSPVFFSKFKDKYGKEPDYRAGLAYDIVGMYTKVIEKCLSDSDTKCIKNELYNIKDYFGSTGLTTINDKGGTEKDIIMYEIINEKFVKIYG